MAESEIRLPSDGVGKRVDTRTVTQADADTAHREVVVLGDPDDNTGVAPVDATSGLKVDLGADNDVTVTGIVAVATRPRWT